MPFTPVTFTDGVTPLNKAAFDGVQAGVIAAERTENKGVANGYASLGADGRVTPAQLASAYSATPPGSPVDGQLWCFAPVAGAIWMFRYNAGSASAYKWEYVGGSPISSSFTGTQTAATVGSYDVMLPALILPRAGEYFFNYSACATMPGVATLVQVCLATAGVNPIPGTDISQTQTASWNLTLATSNIPYTAIAASATVQLGY